MYRYSHFQIACECNFNCQFAHVIGKHDINVDVECLNMLNVCIPLLLFIDLSRLSVSIKRKGA